MNRDQIMDVSKEQLESTEKNYKIRKELTIEPKNKQTRR